MTNDPVAEGHHEKCQLFVAANCAIPIECKHGYDVCPECDPCTCPKEKARNIIV